MQVLTFDCHISGWCSFRIPHSINAHLTYPAPPPTTVYGLIANALGMWQDDYSLIDKIQIGVRILKSGSVVETFSRWMKWNADRGMTTTVVKQKLIQPVYRIYVSAEPSLLNQIHQALHEPARLLYLGDSDDMTELAKIQIQDADKVESKWIDSAVPFETISADNQIINLATIVRWPVRFEQQNKTTHSVEYEMAYLAEKLELAKPISCWKLSHTGDFILFGGSGKDAIGQTLP